MKKGFTLLDLIIVLSILFVLGLIFAGPFIKRAATEDNLTVTVKKTWIKRPSGSESEKYLFSTEEGETFEIADDLGYFSFDAGDRFGQLEEGSTYNITVTGWRIKWASSYRNAVEIEKVEPEIAITTAETSTATETIITTEVTT